MQEIKVKSCMIAREWHDVLDQKGTYDGFYVVEEATITSCHSDLVRVQGTQQLWSYEQRVEDVEYKLPWWSLARIFGGLTHKTKQEKAFGWYKTGNQSFDMVVHSSRISAAEVLD